MCRDLLLLEEAGESLRKAVSLKPGYARAHYNLGTVLELKGHYGEAADNYELAVRYQPRDIPAWQRLVNLKKFTDENGLLDRLQDAISEGTDMTASDKMYFEYILGRACADMRDYPGAFESILKAKSFEAKITPGPKDPLADKPFMELIIEKCTPEFFKERAEYGSKAVAAVIFGMPASGIKPVDKILSSVSRARVVTPGVAANIIQRLFGPDSRLPDFSSVDGDFIEKAVKRHLKSLRGIAKDAPSVIIDSSPVNFFNVWILKLMYPEASLFHCVRDAADTCLDTFFSHSHPLRRFSLKDTGIYYRDIYQPLARHWEKLFPDSLTRVNYAELAESPLEAARSVVKAAGLEWRDECGIFSGAPPDSNGISSLYGERMAELKKIIS
jgi:tetratricopeptide (TPR) repeat protein